MSDARQLLEKCRDTIRGMLASRLGYTNEETINASHSIRENPVLKELDAFLRTPTTPHRVEEALQELSRAAVLARSTLASARQYRGYGATGPLHTPAADLMVVRLGQAIATAASALAPSTAVEVAPLMAHTAKRIEALTGDTSSATGEAEVARVVAPLKPHIYHPDFQAMGDCRVCGHVQESPMHLVGSGARWLNSTEVAFFDAAKEREDAVSEFTTAMEKQARGELVPPVYFGSPAYERMLRRKEVALAARTAAYAALRNQPFQPAASARNLADEREVRVLSLCIEKGTRDALREIGSGYAPSDRGPIRRLQGAIDSLLAVSPSTTPHESNADAALARHFRWRNAVADTMRAQRDWKKDLRWTSEDVHDVLKILEHIHRDFEKRPERVRVKVPSWSLRHLVKVDEVVDVVGWDDSGRPIVQSAETKRLKIYSDSGITLTIRSKWEPA
jgi:hypothetical protein